jgi:hypothetical protein
MIGMEKRISKRQQLAAHALEEFAHGTDDVVLTPFL